MLSVSTCWNSGRHKDGEAMIIELLALGFEYVELGHGIRLPLMEGIQRMYEKGKVRISSLHNFCPLPVEITQAAPDCYQFSSYRKQERERAVKLTFQTIDFAMRLGAPFVVLHLGSVPMKPITRQLAQLAKKGGLFSRKYTQKKLAAVQTREKRAPLYLQRSKECLERIKEYAMEKNVNLCVESREAYEQIPSEREMVPLLDGLNSPCVGYWHDFGHVQIKHNLGFLDHEEWITKIRTRLFGCHLHDVAWPDEDHRAPFTGGIDYDRIIPLLPKDCLFVWEMSPRRTTEEIIESLTRWKKRFGK
jgi:sugar phosphate isomerase/epimerase